MNQTMIDRWNAVVTPQDTVYHLGDFSFSKGFSKRILESLNGYKILVRGNHDGSTQKCLDIGWNEVHNTLLLDLPEGKFRLSHVPPGWFDERRPGLSAMAPDINEDVTMFLCGHIHEKWTLRHLNGKTIINVGVDQWNFEPKTVNELMEWVKNNVTMA